MRVLMLGMPRKYVQSQGSKVQSDYVPIATQTLSIFQHREVQVPQLVLPQMQSNREGEEGLSFFANGSIYSFQVVSFADSMGLDLCQVKPIFPYTASDEDMISNTPPSASNLSNLVKSLQPTPSPTTSLNCPRYLQLIGSTATVWRDPIVVQREIHSKMSLLI